MNDNATPPLAPEAKVAIEDQLRSIRAALDPAFAPSTTNTGKAGATPSAGHCAAVAAIVRDKLGGKFVSTTVQGESHWCNRISVEGEELDVDLTGDQFGFPAVQVAPAGKLYAGCRVREFADLTSETLDRARLLASRAGMHVAITGDAKGELVDKSAEALALHGAAMQRLNEAFYDADKRTATMFEDARALSRALLECMEIDTLDERRKFVLSVFAKLNSRAT